MSIFLYNISKGHNSRQNTGINEQDVVYQNNVSEHRWATVSSKIHKKYVYYQNKIDTLIEASFWLFCEKTTTPDLF